MKHVFTVLALFFALAFAANAQTLTLTAHSAEVAGAAKNQLYPLSSLYFSYNSDTDLFKAFEVETRNLVYEGAVSTVTISGVSTASGKIAWLENSHVKAVTGVWYHLVPRDGIAIRYRSSNKGTELFGRITEGKKPLWSGHLDSIKTGATDSTSALRLTALRKIVRGATPQLVGNNSQAATIAADTSAGTSPTIAITGNGLSGEITLTTGSSTKTTGVIATVTLPVAYPNGCRVALTPSSTQAALEVADVFVATTSTGFTLRASGNSLTQSTANFKWFYTVTGY